MISYRRDSKLFEALSVIQDPELHESLCDLGLIYGVENKKGVVKVVMTLTTPLCPLAPQMHADIKKVLLAIQGVQDVTIDVVWDPTWDPSEMASDEIKDKLGLW